MKMGKYIHYKGELVEVMGVANHSETLEKMVVYKTLTVKPDYPIGTLWVRPYEMFLEKVEVGGKKVPRFKFLK